MDASKDRVAGRPGPRRDHSREAFEALVIDAAEGMVKAEGLRGLGMRRLAGQIGYAPNSIYNALGDLDAVILRLNARTLTRLHDHLASLVRERRSTRARVLRLADGYLDFVLAEPQLWSVLFEHRMAEAEAALPGYYEAALRRAMGLVDEALAPLIAAAEERHRAVASLWASLHGLASLASSGKLAMVSRDDPRRLARLLIGTFLDGLAMPAAAAGDKEKPPQP